jgi:hypothetical protein
MAEKELSAIEAEDAAALKAAVAGKKAKPRKALLIHHGYP